MKRSLYDTIKHSKEATEQQKVTTCKRVIRDLSTEYVRDAGNEFLWVRCFPVEIARLILSHVEDINQLVNIGLVCKLWWRGPPKDAWYKSATNLFGSRPFSILSYMRYRYIPNLPIPIPKQLVNNIGQKIFHFEGFQRDKWTYVKDHPEDGSYYVPIARNPGLLFRPLCSGKISFVFRVAGSSAGVVSRFKVPKEDGAIGRVKYISSMFSGLIFGDKGWKRPKWVSFEFSLVNKRINPGKQHFRFRILLPHRGNAYHIRRRLESGKPTIYNKL